MIRAICSFVLMSLLLASSSNIISAQNVISIAPAFQEVTLAADQESISAPIKITNTTTQPLTLEILPSTVDQQNLSGQLSFELFSGATSQSFPYLSFSNDRFVVDPGQSQEITATISNHATLKAGGTYMGVVFRVVQDQQATDQVLLPGVASLLLIKKLGGETYNLSLSDVRGIPKLVSIFMPSTVGLIFSNNGNVHIQPRGKVTVTGLFDRLLAQSTINESSAYILPGRQRLLQQPLRPSLSVLPLDFVTITMTGSSGEGRTPFNFETSYIYISPWVLIGLALLFSVFVARIIMQHPRLKN